MIVGAGVLVPAERCGAIARLARMGARVIAERDGALALSTAVRDLLDELNAAAVASSTTVPMSARGHAAGAHADIAASSESRQGWRQWETVPAAAGLIGCTDRHVRRLVGSQQLVGRKHGQIWMISRSSIDGYLASRPR